MTIQLNRKQFRTAFLILASLFLALVLAVATSPSAFAAQTGRTGSCDWELTDGGTLYIRPSNGIEGTIGNGSTIQTNYTFNNSTTRSQTKRVIIEGNVKANTTASFMFFGMSNLTRVDLQNLDLSNTVNLNNMFQGCSKLSIVNFPVTGTGNDARADNMFLNCTSLGNVNTLSNWDTSNITNMSYMFDGCSYLNNLTGLSNWNTGNVTDMKYMFRGCSMLKSLSALGNWDLQKGPNMERMFTRCGVNDISGLINWNVSKVSTLTGLFELCMSLTDISGLENWDTQSVTNLSYAFADCRVLSSVKPLEKWNVGNVQNMTGTFQRCFDLTSIDDLKNWDLSSCTSLSNSFQDCTSLQSAHGINNWNTSAVQGFASMFRGCSSLTDLNLRGWVTTSGYGYGYMFYGCTSLESLDISTFDTSYYGGTGNTRDVFTNCTALNYICVGPKTFANTNKTGFALPNSNWVRYANLNNQWVPNGNQVVQPYEITDPYWGWYTRDPDNNPFNFDDLSGVEYISEEGAQTNVWDTTNDVWSYTFQVADDTLEYYLYEAPEISGYSADFVIGNPGTIDPETKTGTVTNIQEMGELTIEKVLIGESSRSFSFTITFTHPGGESVFQGAKFFGDVPFYNGVGRISLAGGGSVTLTGIPYGTFYSVAEDTPAGYTVEIQNPSGQILPGQGIRVIATNTPDEPPPPPPPEDYWVFVEKKLNGHGGEDREFAFTAFFSGLAHGGNYSYVYFDRTGAVMPASEDAGENTAGKTGGFITADADGIAYASFSLKSDERIGFLNLPIGSQYQFTEEGGSWTPAYVVTALQPSLQGAAGLLGQDLSTEYETVDDGETTATVTFTNEMKIVQDLKVKKLVTGSETNRLFDFTIVFNNLDPDVFYNSSLVRPGESVDTVGRYRSDSDGYLEWPFQMKDGDIVTFESLPVGATYQITEAACPFKASYEITNSGEQGTVKKASDGNDAADKRLSTENETIEDGEENTVTFTNTEVKLTQVTINKKWDDKDNAENLRDTSISVQLYAGSDADGKPVPYGLPVVLTGQNQTDKNTWSYTWNDLVAYESDGVTPIEYTVKEAEVIGNDGWNEEPVISGTAEDGYVVTITNKLHEYELKLAKVDQDDNAIGVAGAVFRLYPYNYLKADGSVDTSVEALGKFTSAASEDGKPLAISLGKRSVGTYYLVETKAPSKYVKLTSPIKLTILKNGTATMEIRGNTTEATVTTENTETTGTPSVSITFTVPNPQGSNLPGVGGSGTQIFYISGFGIVLLAGAMMLLTKKKRGTERVRGNQS